MKLRALALRRFGPFLERTLDFPDDGRNLHIIFGPNEAGKSTALAGLGYFLFGFPTRGSYDFRYDLTEQRIAATLVDREGKLFSAVRRRSTKSPFRDADDKATLPNDCLQPFLGDLEKPQFDMLFGINHAQLVEGGANIADGQGSLGQALFAAGAGVAGLGRIKDELDKNLGDLFKARGEKQPINEALSQLQQERQRLREKSVAIETFLARKEQFENSVAEKQRRDEELVALGQDEKRLTSYFHAQPTIRKLADLDAQLRLLQHEPCLPADFGDVYRVTVEQLAEAEALHARRLEDVERAESALAALPAPSPALDDIDAVFDIKQTFGAFCKAEADRDALVENVRDSRAKISSLFRECFPAAEITEAEALRFAEAEGDRVRSLAAERIALVQAVDLAKTRLAEVDATIRDLDERLAQTQLPIPSDGSLEDLEREILKEGPLETNLSFKVDQFRREKAVSERDLALLEPCWKGQLKSIARLQVPSLEKLAAYEKEWQPLDASIHDDERRRDQIAESMRTQTAALAQLETAGPIPDEAELQTARTERDHAIDGLASAPSPAKLQAVRAHVRRCDELSDRLFREADRASKATRLRRELRQADEQRRTILARLAHSLQIRTELEARWLKEWHPGMKPGSPTAMRAWRAQWNTQRERLDHLEKMAREVKAASTVIDGFKLRLRTALAHNDTKTTLEQLLTKARQTLQVARSASAALTEHENRRREALAQRDTLGRQHADAVAAIEQWRASWVQAVEPLRMVDVDPEHALRILDRLHQVVSERRNENAAEVRLAALDRERAEFHDHLSARRRHLFGAAGVSFDPQQLNEAVDELVRRAEDVKIQERERQRLDKELAELRAAFRSAADHVLAHQARLQALGEQAGFASPDELPNLIARSQERRTLEEQAAAERETLRHHAPDGDLAKFSAEAESCLPDLEARLAEIRARQQAIQQEAPLVAVAAVDAERQIDLWRQTSSEAADSQQAIESLLAELRDQATEYAALHLARQMLGLTVERFRERQQDSMLSKAEAYFRRLTRGAYQQLLVEETEKGEPFLLAVRSAPPERVEVAGLSDGARDQLFLAMRLAGIEEHLRTHGPMPVIVDDVLINFDESREAATLECFAELSKTTQILVFTHHAHIVELAKRVAPDAVRCHDLSEPTRV